VSDLARNKAWGVYALDSVIRSGKSRKEELISGWGDFYRRRTFRVVICNEVDPTAHRVAPHHPGVVRLQHVGHRPHVVHPRIEPEIITVRVEDDWHPVVDTRRPRGNYSGGI
jgi:hypothetical protein